MKKITLIFAGIFSVFSINAQVKDTVSTGPGYANGVYYSLENDEVHTVDAANWDIAFTVGPYGSTIRTNGGHGVELFNYPNGDTSHWSSLDTAGISGWKKYYNSDSLWSKGAFSQTSAGMLDLGWGKYSMITHFVTADSLFVLKLPSGSHKKLWIDRLQSGVFYFKYADLDGSNEVLDTIKKSDYTNKSFGYYSVKNSVELDREPDNTSWDLLFTKYGQAVTPTYYMGVSGVLANQGVSVNKVNGVHYQDADTMSTSFSSSMTEIGYNWKSLNYQTYQYAAQDSLTYFVKSKAGDLWKIAFEGFGGSSNGNYIFSKEKILSVGMMESINVLNVSTYPNPTTDFLNIALHQKDNENLNVTVFNMSGSLVYSEIFAGTSGVNNLQLSVGEYAKGLYLVNVESQKASVQTKFIVK
jgi:hypothetical protein